MTRRHNVILGTALVLATILASLPATAGVSWTYGRRDDDGIRKISRQVAKRYREKPDLHGEPAVVLLKSRVWKIDGDSWLVVRNQMIQVEDPSHDGVATRTLRLSPDADIAFKAAWVQRGKKITRLDDEAWKIVPGNDDKATEVILAYPDVKQGDILGWSLEVNNKGFFMSRFIPMADDFPVMLCRTRVQTDGKMAYKLVGEHLRRDNWSRKIIEKKHGAPCDVRLVVTDIPARPRGAYAPTFLEFEPYLLVMFRGGWSKEANRWIFNVSWNEEAVQGSRMLDWLQDEAQHVVTAAREQALGYDTPRERADQLLRFVRDEIVTVNPFEVRSQRGRPRDMLKARQASPRGKSLLFYSMCRSLGLDVEMFGCRNRFYGPPDMANPNLAQLTDYVVRLNGEQPAWYAPAYDDCPPGELPPALRGVTALAIPRGKADGRSEVYRQAFENTGMNETRYWDEYVRLIKEQDWARWIDLPGDPSAPIANTAEMVRWFPEDGEYSVQVHTTGFSDLQEELQEPQEDTRRLADYLSGRLADAEVVEATCTPAPSRAGKSLLAGRVTATPPPPPAGDNWIIPADAVFGGGFLAGWDPRQDDPFIVRFSEDHSATWRAPLPAGWAGARVPPPFSLIDGQFTYHCAFKVQNGDLVVTREVRLLRGLTMYSEVPPFAEKVQKVRDFENSPLVVVRSEG